MRHDLPLDAMSAGRARRARRRRRALGGWILFALVVGLVLTRARLAEHGADAAAARGARALRAALVDGDRGGFERAEAAFLEAARGAVFDVYPVFGLELVDRLRAGARPRVEPALAPAVEALARGDLEAAEAGLSDPAARAAKGHAWLARLVREMSAGASPAVSP